MCVRREGVIADITFTSINNLNCGFDGHQRPILLIMIQSSEGEITRDGGDQALKTWQNQGFQESLAQVLFTNSNESMPGMSRRAEAGVAYEVVRYAPDRHVLIVGTINLLFLLQRLESNLHGKTKRLHLLRSGGGWLEGNVEHRIHR